MSDGLYNQCEVSRKEYYNENQEKILKNHLKIRDRFEKYYLENRDRLISNQKLYGKENRGKIKRYRCDSREKVNEYYKNRREKDLNFELPCNLRSRTSSAFKFEIVRRINKSFDL